MKCSVADLTWPLLILAVVAIALAVARCVAPVRELPSTDPTPTYAIVVTVLPSNTAAPGAAPTAQPSPTAPVPAPTERLPMATATTEPTATNTPEPTRRPPEEMRQRG